MFRVYEMFSSIQGESSFAGRRCFFIRFAGCNLRCLYCDTQKAQTAEAGTEMDIETLVQAADRSGDDCVELTGGEPMLQAETPELARRLLALGKTVLIETNGSIELSGLPKGVHAIVDYKGPSSGMEAYMSDKNFRSLRRTDEVKFVISDNTDFDRAVEIIRKYRLDEQVDNILFSPAWGSDVRAMTERIVREKLPVRVNLQFHKYIWGPETEGV